MEGQMWQQPQGGLWDQSQPSQCSGGKAAGGKGCWKGDGGWGKGKGCGKADQGWGCDGGWKGGGDAWGKGGKADPWGCKGGKGWGDDGSAWKGAGKSMGKGWDDWSKGGWGADPWKGCGKGGKDQWGGCDGKGMGKGKKGEGKPTKVAERIWAGDTPYLGIVNSYNAERMFAYITCEQVWNMVGSDVYCFKTVLEKCGGGVGDLVCFFLHWSPRGQAQASSPILRLSGGERTYALKGTFKPHESGFGFIQCTATKDLFGRDIFVTKPMLEASPLTPGQSVKFNIQVSHDFKPSAVSYEPCEESWEPLAADLSKSYEDPNAASYAPGGLSGFGEEGYKRKRQAEPTGDTMSGMLKSFNERNNWGFIDCEEARTKWGKDVWVVGHNLEDSMKVPGAVPLTFEIALNEKGQPQACNVRRLDGELTGAVADGEPAAKAQRTEEVDVVASALGL